MKYVAWVSIAIAAAFGAAAGCSSGDTSTGTEATSSSSSGSGGGDGGSGTSSGGGGSGGGCESTVKVTPPPFGQPYDDLADWHLFADDHASVPSAGVIPYDVNAPLFTDYTTKTRFVFVPAGKKITYQADTAWDLPVGTALVKNFAMPADLRKPNDKLTLLETRILFHESDGWTAHTYVWSDDQKSAKRNAVGPIISLDFVGEKGEKVHDDYGVPNENQCHQCHGGLEPITPLGVKTRQLNRDHDFGCAGGVENQIDAYAALHLFETTPPPKADRTALVDPYGSESLDLRVRAYWDSNCAHCHRTGGLSGNSGLLLDYLSTDPAQPSSNWGVCKPATANGSHCLLPTDVVPGDPDASLMACRVNTVENGGMPPIGVALVNDPGVALIRDWISSLTGSCGAN